LASSWGLVTIFFYGVRLLAPRPTPNLEGQVIPFCLGHHPWPVAWEALPVALDTASIALGIIWPHKPRHYTKVGIPSGGVVMTRGNYGWNTIQPSLGSMIVI
jgi:hypothetical protein